MEVIKNRQDIVGNQPLVATIGFFDGVHSGHRFLIEQVKKEAKHKSLSSAVITFPVHPRKVLNSDYQPALLCGFDEKIQLLGSTGIDYAVVLDFTAEMSRLSAKEFLQVLRNDLNVDTLIIGYDHRFGHNREEGFEEYKQHAKELGITVIQAKESNPQEHVSSSRIRRLLGTGEIKFASKLLSYNYTISGKIVEGFKVGRTIGFPTANIQVWEDYKVIPAFGVYAAYVHIDGAKYCGMLYIGKRPTLHNGDNISVEVNVFDFDDNLYDKSLTVEFIDFIRGDEKFSTIGVLKASILQDKYDIQDLFKRMHTNKS